MTAPNPTLVALELALGLPPAVLAVYTDLRERRLPHVWSAVLFGAGLGLHGAVGGFAGLLEAVECALALGLPFLVLALLGGAGGGDWPFAAGLGALAGRLDLLLGMVLPFLALSLLTVAGLVLRQLLARRPLRAAATEAIPLGPLLAAAWAVGLLVG